jgi:hypothetical protein
MVLAKVRALVVYLLQQPTNSSSNRLALSHIAPCTGTGPLTPCERWQIVAGMMLNAYPESKTVSVEWKTLQLSQSASNVVRIGP